MNSFLSGNIRYLRKKNRMSQSQLASKLSRSESAIQMWETDLRSPTMEMVLQISQLFGVEINDLVYTNLEDHNNKPVMKEITNINDAMLFLLSNPVVSAYGGYDFDRMSDEEKIQFANKMMGVLKMVADDYK